MKQLNENKNNRMKEDGNEEDVEVQINIQYFKGIEKCNDNQRLNELLSEKLTILPLYNENLYHELIHQFQIIKYGNSFHCMLIIRIDDAFYNDPNQHANYEKYLDTLRNMKYYILDSHMAASSKNYKNKVNIIPRVIEEIKDEEDHIKEFHIHLVVMNNDNKYNQLEGNDEINMLIKGYMDVNTFLTTFIEQQNNDNNPPHHPSSSNRNRNRNKHKKEKYINIQFSMKEVIKKKKEEEGEVIVGGRGRGGGGKGRVNISKEIDIEYVESNGNKVLVLSRIRN